MRRIGSGSIDELVNAATDLWFKESGEVVDIGTILPIVASATSGRSFMALLRDSP